MIKLIHEDPSLKQVWGGIEAGGTKFVCAFGTNTGEILGKIQIPTQSPNETLEKVIDFFLSIKDSHVLTGLGVGCFGPLDISPKSPTYGFITNTPKVGWENLDLLGRLEYALDVPVAIDTDVNAAALGEHKWGAAQGISDFIYLTVGTGIGGGVMTNGEVVHGLVHPEIGHMFLPRKQADPFPGICPFHGDCLEGLASGPAMYARWGVAPELLPPDHPAWDLEAEYLAYAVANLIMAYSPKRIILGGGVCSLPDLFPKMRGRVRGLINGYVRSPMIEAKVDDFIVMPGLGSLSGVMGAIAIAQARRS